MGDRERSTQLSPQSPLPTCCTPIASSARRSPKPKRTLDYDCWSCSASCLWPDFGFFRVRGATVGVMGWLDGGHRVTSLPRAGIRRSATERCFAAGGAFRIHCFFCARGFMHFQYICSSACSVTGVETSGRLNLVLLVLRCRRNVVSRCNTSVFVDAR